MSYFNEDGLIASNSSVGLVAVQAGSGLAIDSNGNISNTDKGSTVNLISNIAVLGDGYFVANSHASGVVFSPGGRMVLGIVGNVISITDNAHAPKTTRCLDKNGNYTQSDVIATLPEDTFVFAEGGNGGIAITTDPTNKIITFTHTGILNVAVSGSGLTANNSGNLGTITSNATASNIANTIVYRDNTGNFTAGNVTVGNIIGTHYGNTVGTTATYIGNVNSGNVIATSGQFGNISGELIRSNRDAGTINSGSLNIDMINDDMVHFTIGGTVTVVLGNIVPGKIVTVMATNTSGVSNRTLNLGVTQNNTSGSNTSFSVGTNRTSQIKYSSFGTANSAVYASTT